MSALKKVLIAICVLVTGCEFSMRVSGELPTCTPVHRLDGLACKPLDGS